MEYKNRLSCKWNTMAADDLATHVARTSAAMVLTKLSQNEKGSYFIQESMYPGSLHHQVTSSDIIDKVIPE